LPLEVRGSLEIFGRPKCEGIRDRFRKPQLSRGVFKQAAHAEFLIQLAVIDFSQALAQSSFNAEMLSTQTQSQRMKLFLVGAQLQLK